VSIFNLATAVFVRYALSSYIYIAWFTFPGTLAHSIVRLFSRLFVIEQKHGKALRKSHKLLVPLQLLLQPWNKCIWSSLLAFWNEPNRPVSDDLQNVTYPAVS